jgi:DNA-binding NtrC family response regulator
MTPTRLLIVDDHAGMTMSIRMVAESLGYECRTVNHPEEAARAFAAFGPDVLILDMMMPEKDGLDVLDEILAMGTEAKIILTSGYGDGFLRMGERMVRQNQRKQVLFLKKPFRREELVGLLTDM